jgi:hypothetical protein
VASAAFSISVSSTGSVKALKTTPLMSMAESVDAMKKAGGSAYQPPK